MKSLLRKTPKKNVSKYSGVETRAIELLSEYSQGSIDNDLFGEQMENVAKEFHTLMKDESRAYVFDKDTPGWLNLFLGNKFSRWNHVRKLINASKDNPEITSSSEWTNALEIMKQENKNLINAIKYCLEEIKRTFLRKLKYIPLAVVIAMSPMISSNVQAQTIYTFSGEKIIAKDTIQDLNGKNKVLLYLSSDGNDNDAERLAFNIKTPPKNKYDTRTVYDSDLKKSIKLRVYQDETQYIDSLVLLKTHYSDGNIGYRYFVSGPCIIKNTAFYAENGELYKDFPPRLAREDQSSSLEVSKNTFDDLKEVFPPSLVKEEYIKIE